MLSKWQDFILFIGWVIFRCVGKPNFIHPFIYLLTLTLLPFLGYYKWCCNKHRAYIVFWLVFSFSLEKYWEVELSDHMVVPFLSFWGISILFSVVVAPVYIPNNSVREFPFLHTLSTFIICRLFNDGQFWLVWSGTSFLRVFATPI